MSDPDARGAPAPGRGADTLEPPEPPVTGVLTYQEKRTVGVDLVSSPDDVARSPVTVTVDGNKTLVGTQRADALALLGISEEVLDEAWYQFAGEVNAGQNAPLTGDPEWGIASQHQAGMGWQVEVEVVQDPKDGIEGLANIDPRTAKREVTFWAMKWNTTTTYPPIPEGVKPKRMPLEDAGALGASWREVDEGEMESTKNAADALRDAHHELESALEEIQVAIKVADAAWKGPRSEITKLKFAAEYEMIGALLGWTDEWRQYLDDLVKEQRDAKEAIDALRSELFVEGVLFLATGLAGKLITLTFSAARAAKAARVGERVVSYAEKIGRIVAPLRARCSAVVDQISRSSVALHSTRILARGAGGLATTAAVNHAGGRQTTTEDWVLAFVLAGAGHGASELTATWVRKIENKHGVTYTVPGFGAAKGAADGAAQHPVKALFTDDALEASFGRGVLAGAVQETVGARLKKNYRDLLENDPDSPALRQGFKNWSKAIQDAYPDDVRKPLQQFIDDETAKLMRAFERKIDPMLDFASAVGTQAADKAHETTTRPPPPLDLPDMPRGTVAQPVGKR